MINLRRATAKTRPANAAWFTIAAVAMAASCTPAAMAAPGPPPHGARTVLVELFTSQGCSSCPVADDFVRALPSLGWGRTRVVPLTFHVDYWDDLGWKDPFATPAMTARQRRYAGSHWLTSPTGDAGLSGIYTPQMIVDGQVQFPGGNRALALAEIARAAARPTEATLAAQARVRGGDAADTREIVVAGHVARPGVTAAGVGTAAPAPSTPPATEPWQVIVALSARETRTRVARGENAGQTLLEAAVVRTLSPPIAIDAARPDQDAAFQVSLRSPRDLRWDELEITAFVQAARTGRVIASANVPLTFQ